MFDGEGVINDKFILSAGSTATAEKELYLSRNARATISGTLTINKSSAAGDPVADGLVLGGWHGTLWNKSVLRVTDGGLLEAKNSKVALGKTTESGEFLIESGGEANVWGIEDKGAWGKVIIQGGTLKLGEGGIHFTDQSYNHDASNKTGENYLSDVYFSAGELVIEEDSAYTYTGKKEFEEIFAGDPSGKNPRPASSYTGNFFFGKDDKGAIDADSTRVIKVADGATFTLGDIVLGDGGFNKKGKGTVVLAVANKYKGNTVVEEGSLYLGDDSALGTGSLLTLLGGTTLAAQSKAISLTQSIVMGSTGEEKPLQGEAIHLGTTDKNEKLNIKGVVTINSSIQTLDVMADTTFSGAVTSLSAKLIKEGNGTLTFTNALNGMNEMEIKGGNVDFDSAESLVDVNQIKVTAGNLDLSDFATASEIHFIKTSTFAGVSSYTGTLQLGNTTTKDNTAWAVSTDGNTQAGSVLLNNQNARLNVNNNGSFSTKSITFTLGFNNASSSVNTNTLITASSAKITGTDKGSFVLNFDPLYIHDKKDQGGRLVPALLHRSGLCLRRHQKQSQAGNLPGRGIAGEDRTACLDENQTGRFSD